MQYDVGTKGLVPTVFWDNAQHYAHNERKTRMDYLMQENASQAYAQQAKYAAQQSGQSAGGVGVSTQTIMSAAHMEMDNLTEHASRNTAKLREIRDRLFGPQPEKASGTPPRPVPNGAVQLLGEKVETVKAILRDQTALIDELMRIA
jgi:hypothetical protein